MWVTKAKEWTGYPLGDMRMREFYSAVSHPISRTTGTSGGI